MPLLVVVTVTPVVIAYFGLGAALGSQQHLASADDDTSDPVAPTTLESALAAQLVSGEISRR
jgi:hypothetical protein